MSTRRSARWPASSSRERRSATPRRSATILVSQAGTGEVLHARLRTGSADTARGARRFRGGARRPRAARQRHRRDRGAARLGVLVQRHHRDSGPHRRELDDGCAGEQQRVSGAIAAIAEGVWLPIDYTADADAQVAETLSKERRLVVRRTRLTDRRQPQLWPNWRPFAFLPTSTATRWPSMSSTARRRRSSSTSATSRKAPGSSTPAAQFRRQRRMAAVRRAGTSSRSSPEPLQDALAGGTPMRTAHCPCKPREGT
jgi:hypothetical protein